MNILNVVEFNYNAILKNVEYVKFDEKDRYIPLHNPKTMPCLPFSVTLNLEFF